MAAVEKATVLVGDYDKQLQEFLDIARPISRRIRRRRIAAFALRAASFVSGLGIMYWAFVHHGDAYDAAVKGVVVGGMAVVGFLLFHMSLHGDGWE
mgnify:FL=1